MRTQLRKCKECGNYTLKDICSCGKKTCVPIPPRYSPQDRYGSYRRKLKEIHRKEKI